jgi:hypothetical protein
MNATIIACMLFSSSALALQASDPETICETNASVSSISSFKHCEKGDLITVGAYEMQRVCDLNSTILPLQNEYVCVYRGTKRDVRKRPLSEAEKALEKEHLEGLVEKYSD